MTKKKVSNEVVKIDPVESTPQTLIQQGLESGASIEVMERMFNLQERWEKNQAKKVFDQAMSEAQAKLPEIKKTKKVFNKQGQELYAYAPIEQIVSQVKKVLSEFGLSYSIKTEMTKNDTGQIVGVKSTVVVKHSGGHSEEYEMEVPLGTATNIMSQSQVIAAASTFSKRYAFSNAFGIMTADQDKEENFKPADEGEVEKAIKQLDQCTKDEQVVKLWGGFSKELKANAKVVEKTAGMRRFIKEAKENEKK
jgi:hypothetical protein